MHVLLTAGLLAIVQTLQAPDTSASSPATVPPGIPLPELVRTAIAHGIDLRIERLRPRLAGAELLAALSAFDPQISVSSGISNQSIRADGLPMQPRENRTTSYGAAWAGRLPTGAEYRLGFDGSVADDDPFDPARAPFPSSYASGIAFGFTQPLLRGAWPGQATGQVRAAELGVDAASSRYARQVDVALSEVEIAYYGLAYAEAVEEVARLTLEGARATHQRNVELRELDLATELEVLSAERLVASREMALLQAERQVEDAREALVFLVWGDAAPEALTRVGPGIRTTTGALHPPLPDLETPVDEVLTRRADVQAARLGVARAERELSLARNLRLPDVSLTGTVARSAVAPERQYLPLADSLGIRDLSWSLGLRLALPLRNRVADARIETAHAELEAARLALAAVENAAREEVLRARRALRTALERREKAQVMLDAATRLYEAADQAVRLGLISNFELLRYEEDLANARLFAVQVDYEVATAVTAVRLAEGSIAASYGIDPRADVAVD